MTMFLCPSSSCGNNNLIWSTEWEVCLYRGGGTGPADLAAAGPKLNRNPQFKMFAIKHTDSFNESTNDTTYCLCKTIALLE